MKISTKGKYALLIMIDIAKTVVEKEIPYKVVDRRP